MDKKVIQKSSGYFTEEEKHSVIKDYFLSGKSKQEIWNKYTGKADEHGSLLRWMRSLGYDTNPKIGRRNIEENPQWMPKKKKPDQTSINPDENFESLHLKKRIAELEKQLKEAELKAIAFSTMVDIAEQEFKIPIRKKFSTKP